jgi:gamma-glutamyltranspeptidase / glutathione hydrolase
LILCRCVLALFVLGVLMPFYPAGAQDRNQGRSMVISRDGIVAAESPLAAQAGAMILARGGNAVDAAVAANAVMGVVAPMMDGIGGDLFAIVYDAKTGKLYGLNASGWAPAAISADFLKGKGFKEMPETGIHSVTVPGAVDGWSKLLEKFGTKKFPDVLSAAIHYAREGFPVPEWDAEEWESATDAVRNDPHAASVFLPGGRAPHVGEIFKNPDLAHSLELISSSGRDAFYKGEIARRILVDSAKLGGTMSAEDLASFSSEWDDPIWTSYRGWKIYEMPPNGQGIAVLEMLNIMETFPLPQYGHHSADALHVMIEAKKLAYADLYRYVGDRNFAQVPVARMINKEFAADRARLINMSNANCAVGPAQPMYQSGGNTTYLSVVDRAGNMVSLIQSNAALFGSGVVAEGTGFALQDRGAGFSLDASSPNLISGHKRPFHTIIPAFMAKGEIRIAFGIMGGANQPQAHAQFVSNIADFGLNIQAALESARFSKYSVNGCDVEMEDRVPEAARKALAERGHEIQLCGNYSPDMGGGQAVLRDFSKGVNYGASDPRKDGEAIPEPPSAH